MVDDLFFHELLLLGLLWLCLILYWVGLHGIGVVLCKKNRGSA